MTFDIDDIATVEALGVTEDLILHEMGHVIGIGLVLHLCTGRSGQSATQGFVNLRPDRSKLRVAKIHTFSQIG